MKIVHYIYASKKTGEVLLQGKSMYDFYNREHQVKLLNDLSDIPVYYRDIEFHEEVSDEDD